MMRADSQLLSNDYPVEGTETEETEAGQHTTGVVKWFDVTRGFGFVVSDNSELGDVLVHFTVLQEHGRRSLPEGARVECVAVKRNRGFQAREIIASAPASAAAALEQMRDPEANADVESLRWFALPHEIAKELAASADASLGAAI